MTNLNTVFSNWSAPVFAGILAMTAATSGVSAESSRIDIKNPKTERLTRSSLSASQQADTQLRLRGGKMETRMQNGKMVLTGFAGAFGGGQVQLTGNMPVDHQSEKSADLRFADVSVEKAGQIIGNPSLVAWLGNTNLSGSVKGEWEGKGASQISRSADGTLTLVAGNGVITDKKVLEKLGSLAGISELEQLRFDSIKIKAHAADGKIVIDAASVEGPDLNLALVGNYSVQDDHLDLKIAMSVAPEIASKSSYLKVKNVLDIFRSDNEPNTEGEFVEVPVLLVSGDLKKPDVKLDKSKPARTTAAAADSANAANQADGGFMAKMKQLAKTVD